MKIDIDTKTGIVTIEGETIYTKSVKSSNPVKRLLSKYRSKKKSQTVPDHIPLTGEQREDFSEARKAVVGDNVIMPDGLVWTVTEHIRGSQYKVGKFFEEDGSLNDEIIEVRYATHNKKKNLWDWWEDGKTVKPAVRRDDERSKGATINYPATGKCSICGMIGVKSPSCASWQTDEGEWRWYHRATNNRAAVMGVYP